MNARVIAIDGDGRTAGLGTPVALTYTANLLQPYRSLEVTLRSGAQTQDLRELMLTLDGETFFNGVIDQRSHLISKDGVFHVFSCRSKGGAQMSDNQQAPYTYFQVTDTQMMDTYAKPFGIVGSRFDSSASLNIFAVAERETYWDLMRNYCLQVYHKHPYVDKDNYINLTPYSGRNRKISNTAADGLRFASSETTRHRDAISKLYIKTGEDDFGNLYDLSYTNDVAQEAGIRREQYVDLTRSWEADADLYAQLQFFYSQIDMTEITVELPGWQDLELGDGITLEDGVMAQQNLYVGEYTVSVEEQGYFTKVKLWDKRYLSWV